MDYAIINASIIAMPDNFIYLSNYFDNLLKIFEFKQVEHIARMVVRLENGYYYYDKLPLKLKENKVLALMSIKHNFLYFTNLPTILCDSADFLHSAIITNPDILELLDDQTYFMSKENIDKLRKYVEYVKDIENADKL